MTSSEDYTLHDSSLRFLVPRMIRIHEGEFFSKPRRYLRPPRRRLRFVVCLQVVSAVFAGPAHLGNGEIGFARRCFFIYSSARDRPQFDDAVDS